MKPLYCLAVLTIVFVCANNPVQAAFVLGPKSADLQFNGAGTHSVDFVITHNGVGASTLSGYTMRFGSTANASLGVLPSGVSATGATERLNVSGGLNGLFNYNTLTNSLSASNFSVAGPFADLGSGGSATLFTLALNLGSASSYTIGVDFQNAQRGGLLGTEIGNEFFDPNSPTTDFSFTLIQAVPEPTSLIMAATLLILGIIHNRRKLSSTSRAEAGLPAKILRFICRNSL